MGASTFCCKFYRIFLSSAVFSTAIFAVNFTIIFTVNFTVIFTVILAMPNKKAMPGPEPGTLRLQGKRFPDCAPQPLNIRLFLLILSFKLKICLKFYIFLQITVNFIKSSYLLYVNSVFITLKTFCGTIRLWLFLSELKMQVRPRWRCMSC